MSFGLVSYGDSDDSDDEAPRAPARSATSKFAPPFAASKSTSSSTKQSPSSNVKMTGDNVRRPAFPIVQEARPDSSQFRAPVPFPPPHNVPPPNFRQPPPPVPVFPSAVAAAQRQPAHSNLDVNRDERGRVRIAAPRLDNPDPDSDDDTPTPKRPKPIANQPQAGLFSILPDPKGPPKRNEASAGKASQYDQMFAEGKKRPGSSGGGGSSQTIKVPSASTIRYEAELKKAQMIHKYMKKAPLVEAPERSGQGAQGKTTNAAPGSEEVDYLGLTPRPVVHFSGGGGPREDVEWEVDESAYDEAGADMGDQAEPSDPASGPSGPLIPQAPMWTANYKYQDVGFMLDHAVASAPQPTGYRTQEQVEKLIARHEGPDFQEQLNAGRRIDLVDFRADELLGDARANVMRGITDQASNPPPRAAPVKGKVNRTAKAKGQITYLAAQAQARETELQNEWAKGRQARTQSSQRYGF